MKKMEDDNMLLGFENQGQQHQINQPVKKLYDIDIANQDQYPDPAWWRKKYVQLAPG